MTTKPIIFSGPMVRAILEGRKTQTRRILKTQPNMLNGGLPLNNGRGTAVRVRYAVGDLLWVREACFAESSPDGDGDGVAYPADRSWRIIDYTKKATEKWLDLLYYRRRNDDGFEGSAGKLVSPIHMPRWASRITLAVTAVRVQRLQDISEDDAQAEGMCGPLIDPELDRIVNQIGVAPSDAFKALWNSLHGPDAWAANPWVAAISFERVT